MRECFCVLWKKGCVQLVPGFEAQSRIIHSHPRAAVGRAGGEPGLFPCREKKHQRLVYKTPSVTTKRAT